METTDYKTQANEFLTKYGIKFSAVHKADKCPPFCDGKHIHGHRYRVTLTKGKQRTSFDFWNSLNDVQKNNKLCAYDVLACISGDVNCPEDFEDFCGDYGYDTDSRQAEKTFKRLYKFAQRLQAFFSEEEIEALQEIH